MVIWDKEAYYILQPSLDQSVSLARLIKKTTQSSRVVALRTKGEGRVPSAEYDDVQQIDDYRDVPVGLRVVPTGATSTEALLAIRDVALGEITLDRNALLAYDKNAFLALCRDSNLPIPITYSSLREVPVSAYPVFYKESHEQGGGARGIGRTVDDVPAHEDGALIFQEYIDTPGTYGVGFLAKDGALLASFSHFERESFPATGGSAVLIERVDDPVLIDMTAKVVRAMNYSGWGLAEFKYSRKAAGYVFMEVNAKFWASCGVAFEAQPQFMKRLFGIDVTASSDNRWFFVNRGLSRGALFMLQSASLLLTSKRVVLPGVGLSLLRGLVPKVVIDLVRGRH